jgi:hypothetical protein
MNNTNIPHRVQLYEWKKGKVIPKPKTIEKIQDKNLQADISLKAIEPYLQFIPKEKLLIKLMENKEEK